MSGRGLKRTVTIEKNVPIKRSRITKTVAKRNSRLFSKSGTGRELKNIDAVVQNNNLTSTNSLVLLNGIQSGTGPNAMIGRRCTLKSFQIKYAINPLAQPTASLLSYIGEAVRVLVVYDKEPEGTTPGITDIIVQNTSQQAAISPMNLTNSDRFIVLMDRMHAMGPYDVLTGAATYSVTGGNINVVDQMYRKINLPFEGPSTSGSITGINCGAVFMLALGTNGTPGFTISYTTRIRYSDM